MRQKTNLYSIHLRWWLISSFIVLIFSKCVTPKNEQFLDEDILFLIIPIQEGCHGCVAKAMSFVDQNSTLIQSVSEFEIIASSIYDKRVFDLSTYKCVLAPFIVDTSNVYARRVNLGIYPLLVRREGSEVDILKLESENIDDVLSKLERGLLTRNKKYFEFWSVFSYFEGNRN